jgi:rhodanese-related sulfurtransferase
MDHSNEFLELVNAARSRVREITVAEAPALIHAGAVLIDVRDDNEWAAGHAKGAVHMGRGVIERDIVKTFPDKGTPMVLYCGGGYRSALAADNLQRMGYTNVISMDGGWKGWVDAGFPTE